MENNSIISYKNNSEISDKEFKDNDEEYIKVINNYSRRSSFSILSSDSNNIISTFSLNINQNYTRKNTVTESKRIKIKKSKYIFCLKCSKFYIIDFKDYMLNFECDCFEIKNYTIDNFIYDFTITDKEKVEKYSKCKKHNEKKYSFYCEECKYDLCDECLKETKIYIIEHQIVAEMK